MASVNLQDAPSQTMLHALWAKGWPPGMPTAPQYPLGELPLTRYLRHWANVQPDHPAVIYYGHVLSFAALDRLSDAMARLLQSMGVGAGDRVAVFLPNCPQFHLAFYGILKLGAVHVPVGPMSKSYELLHELQDSGATLLITLDAFMPVVRQVRAQTELRAVLVTSYADVRADDPVLPLPEAMRASRQHCDDAVELMPALAQWLHDEPWPAADSLDALAALNYTGGTTGLPKGCMHTQRDMLYTAAANCGVAIHNAPDTVFLSFFLQSWIAGENGGLIFHVFCGKPLVLLSRWDPVAVLQAVARYRVTSMVMTVDSALELLDHPQFLTHDLRSLRQPRVVSFMKKLSLGDRVRWRDGQGSNLVESAWGMTETHTSDTFTTGLQHDDFDLKSTPVFIGLPVPGTEFRVCDFESRAVLPLGASGELCIRTPSLFKGYWRQPQATAAVLSGDWFHTGDIGMIDADGFLHYLGRRKEMIKVKGMSVFPMEIEAVLGRHELVLGSGVVALADERHGEVPVAFVQLRLECALPDVAQVLRDWCEACMASYKVPQLRLVDRLPVTATGKVDKKVLLQWLAAEDSAQPN